MPGDPENDAADEGNDLVIGNLEDEAHDGADQNANRDKPLPQRSWKAHLWAASS